MFKETTAKGRYEELRASENRILLQHTEKDFSQEEIRYRWLEALGQTSDVLAISYFVEKEKYTLEELLFIYEWAIIGDARAAIDYLVCVLAKEESNHKELISLRDYYKESTIPVAKSTLKFVTGIFQNYKIGRA